MSDPDNPNNPDNATDEPDDTVRTAESGGEVGPSAAPITRQGQRLESEQARTGDSDDLAP